jgi:hypothetical protein
MRIFLKKKFKQFNKGSDVIVTFEEGNELIKKGFGQLDPIIEEVEEIKEIKTKSKKIK